MDNNRVLEQLKSFFDLSRKEASEQFGHDLIRYFGDYFENPQLLATYLEACRRIVEITEGKDKTFLDLGSGYGLLSICLLISGAKKVISVEINKEKVKTMRKILDTRIDVQGNISAYCSDIMNFDLQDEKPEVAVANQIINHVPDLFNVLKKSYGLLGPKGTLYINDSCNIFYPPLFFKFRKHWQFMEYGPSDIKIQKDYSAEPYYEMRRSFIKDSFPSLDSRQINRLAFRTYGLTYAEIKPMVEKYCESGCLKKTVFNIKWCKEPVHGIYNEKLISPFSLQKDLKKIGFKPKLIKHQYGYGKSTVKNIIKLILNISWLFLTPKIELTAKK
jgi:SAM-dependent methyltransferase